MERPTIAEIIERNEEVGMDHLTHRDPGDETTSRAEAERPIDLIALVTLRGDGTVEYGPDYSPDAAARIFWEGLAERNPLLDEVARLRAEIDRLTAALAAEQERVTAAMAAHQDAVSWWEGEYHALSERCEAALAAERALSDRQHAALENIWLWSLQPVWNRDLGPFRDELLEAQARYQAARREVGP